MVLKPLLYGILLILIATCTAFAQPVLPDIAGVAGRGMVTLSWQCPYNSVKAISVLRATDSNAEFSIIGYVEQRDKGIQTFKDIHPLAGRNCYKLVLEFKTGLIWRSNYSCVKVEPYNMESEKKLLPESKVVSQNQMERKPEPTVKSADPAQQPASLKLKMAPIPDDTVDNALTQIQPRYCRADARTGIITLMLPPDVDKCHYSIKFFDLQNHLLTEVPHIGTATILFDKRNFHCKKIIRFVLRKDGVELEEGWIKTPNP